MKSVGLTGASVTVHAAGRTAAVALWLVIAMLALLTLGGCGADDEVATPETDAETVTSEPVATPSEALEAMPADGPGESAAIAALPGLLGQAEQERAASGQAWPDLAGAEPSLTAYILVADLEDQSALLEVRADGIVHGIYAYQRAFDAAALIWMPAGELAAPRSAPQSEREKSAVAAAQAALEDSFPDGGITAGVFGYRFTYQSGGVRLLTIEIATDGTLISVSG